MSFFDAFWIEALRELMPWTTTFFSAVAMLGSATRAGGSRQSSICSERDHRVIYLAVYFYSVESLDSLARIVDLQSLGSLFSLGGSGLKGLWGSVWYQ